MAIRNAKLGGTDIAFGEAGQESADYNGTFNEVINRNALVKNSLRTLITAEKDATNPVTFTDADFDNWTWDSAKDSSKYDETNSSNVVYDATAKAFKLDVDTGIFTYDYDFTGIDSPTGWTKVLGAVAGGSASITFDASNDEEDYAAATDSSSQHTSSCYIENDNTVTFCSVKCHINAMTHTAGGSTTGSCSATLTKGAEYLAITRVNGNWIISDSGTGSNVDTGSATFPADVWFKITIKLDGSLKTEYSLTGDSGYNIISDDATGGDISAVKPKVTASIGNGSSNVVSSCTMSIQDFSIAAGYKTSGYYISDVITVEATITSGLITAKKTTPTNTAITLAASADNGANYESHTEATGHEYINTGTQLKVKITLTTSDTTVTPLLNYFGYQWQE